MSENSSAAPRGHTPLDVLLLAPSGDADEIDATLRRALTAAGVRWSVLAPDTTAPARCRALILYGGMGVREFLDVDAAKPGTVRADVVEAIQSAHRAGAWIGAPCVALAVVMKALEDEVTGGAANNRRVVDGVAVFPDLRAVSTHRPLIGRGRAEREPLVERFIATLLASSAGPSPVDASLIVDNA